MSTPVAVVGASGYTGGELVRLLSSHPRAEVTAVFANRRAGQHLSAVFPSFGGVFDPLLEEVTPERVAESAEVVFLALPHGASAALALELSKRGKVVIDLSADFRLKDKDTYAKWYGTPHVAPELLESAVYGLPEFFRNDILGADLVASPGCYPTATALAIAPLLEAQLVEAEGIIVDAKSGASGAGRTPGLGTHLPEAGEGIRAYKVAGTHRHTPEMEQVLSELSGRDATLVFTPHLVPMTRGILACVYARPTDPEAPVGTYLEALVEAYAYEPFVTVLENSLPDTAHVRGSNRAHVTVRYDHRTQTVMAICAIDNLVKGAAGQAVQCFNLVQGFPETEGLEAAPQFP